MCVNLQWQLCAVQGKLPNQGSPQISFATAPKDLKVEWWEDPANNPVMGKWTPFGCCLLSGRLKGRMALAQRTASDPVLRHL